VNTRVWTEPESVLVPEAFRDAVGGNPLVAALLWRRGIRDVQRAQAFINPMLYQATTAFALPDMDAACARVVMAIERGERVGVWGDFDVDGQTATALLVSALGDVGLTPHYYIPDRETEGHGVYVPKLRQWVTEQRISLVITCDTGIAAHEAVEAARTLGVEMVITDHHQLPPTLPDALACVNPQRLEAGHPLRTLAGVGVAYKLIEAVFARGGAAVSEVERYLDLVALGLIADVALLVEDTRFLTQQGLARLRNSERMGLRALYAAAGLDAESLDERDVAFTIAPRLNALGRLGDANHGVELLITQDNERAQVLANQLEGLNNQRRMLSKQVYAAAENLIQRDASLLDYNALVVAHPHWPGGVIGLVANQLAEAYQRPVVMLSLADDVARGSARSVEGVDITAVLHSQQHLLLGYGGHAMAAGLRLPAARVQEFRRGLSQAIGTVKQFGDAPALAIDASVALGMVDLSLVEQMRRLAPFGAGNPAPILATNGVSIVKQRKVGRGGEHLVFTVEDGDDHQREVMWWGFDAEELPSGSIDLAFTARVNRYKGETKLQLEYVDLRALEPQAETTHAQQVFVDCRANPHEGLAQARARYASVIVWHEGGTLDGVEVVARDGLVPCEALVIWSAPPSYQVLADAIARVNPKVVYVALAYSPTLKLMEFLERVGGIAKYAIAQLGGQVDLARAAARLGVTSKLVMLGLRYWSAQGKIRIVNKNNEIWFVESGVGEGTREDSESVLRQIQRLIDEVNAFKGYMGRIELDSALLL